MAYPCGGQNHDDRVAEIIKNNTGVKYSRTIVSNYSFEPQANLYKFNPTMHHRAGIEKLMEMGNKFLEMKADTPQIFYIWGHSFEFDFEENWDAFENFCKMMSGHDDIFYGTNKEILL
jgi:hypothetical protein